MDLNLKTDTNILKLKFVGIGLTQKKLTQRQTLRLNHSEKCKALQLHNKIVSAKHTFLVLLLQRIYK